MITRNCVEFNLSRQKKKAITSLQENLWWFYIYRSDWGGKKDKKCTEMNWCLDGYSPFFYFSPSCKEEKQQEAWLYLQNPTEIIHIFASMSQWPAKSYTFGNKQKILSKDWYRADQKHSATWHEEPKQSARIEISGRWAIRGGWTNTFSYEVERLQRQAKSR